MGIFRQATVFFAVLSMSAFAKDGVTKYKGAWFEIEYPSAFAVEPSLTSQTMPGEYDSVFFAAPDESVRFYIFSPQWGGENRDINVRKGEHAAVTDKSETKDGTTRRYFTIKPKGEGMTRSYVETTNADKTVRWVIGIEYADQQAYDKYKSAYLKFKKSLKQFAD